MSSSRTERSATSKSGPKPPVNFSSTLTIASKAILQGTHSITIQADSVVHPGARFESSVGSILVGRRSVIHERAQIGATPDDPESARPGGVSVGDYVIVEADAIIESGNTEIGDGSILQVGCRVGAGAKVGNNCTLTPMSTIPPGEVLPPNTVVYGHGMRRTDRRGLGDLRKAGLVKQIAILRKMIPSDQGRFQT